MRLLARIRRKLIRRKAWKIESVTFSTHKPDCRVKLTNVTEDDE